MCECEWDCWWLQCKNHKFVKLVAWAVIALRNVYDSSTDLVLYSSTLAVSSGEYKDE